MQLAALLFTLAALGGLTMAGICLSATPSPADLARIWGHGAIAAAGLFAFIYAAATQRLPTVAVAAVGCLVLTAVSGATIFALFHVRAKPLPIPLVLGHGAIALTAFVRLLVSICQ